MRVSRSFPRVAEAGVVRVGAGGRQTPSGRHRSQSRLSAGHREARPLRRFPAGRVGSRAATR